MQIKFMIAAGILFLLGISLIVLSNFVTYIVIGEVNARSDPKDRISMFFLQSKMGRMLERHRSLYPDSRWRRLIYILGIAGVALVFVAFFVFVAPNFFQPSR